MVPTAPHAAGDTPMRPVPMVLAACVGVVAILAAQFGGLPWSASATAGVAAATAVMWVTEALPIPLASLVPFAMLPLLAGIDHKVVARGYGHHIIILLLGGFMLSRAVERCGLHRRIAIALVRALGRYGARGLVLGFMVATALNSMWISNSATTLALIPVAMAVLDAEKDRDRRRYLAVPLLLGIAYAASIGGLGTKIGTPANQAAIAGYEKMFGREIGFLEWMTYGLPVVALLVPIAWLYICRSLGTRVREVTMPDPVGAWQTAEKRVATVFGITALGWIFRSEPFGGWSALCDVPGVGDGTVALAGVLACCIVSDGRGGRLLDWPSASDIPWGLLLLFGGGLALAGAFVESGLSESVGSGLERLIVLPPIVLVPLVCLIVTFLTELTSNTAMVVLLTPILGAAAAGSGEGSPSVDPLLLIMPATLSASCAFMMPVATAPNAIVFGTGQLTIARMAREGLVVNLLGSMIVSAWITARTIW